MKSSERYGEHEQYIVLLHSLARRALASLVGIGNLAERPVCEVYTLVMNEPTDMPGRNWTVQNRDQFYHLYKSYCYMVLGEAVSVRIKDINADLLRGSGDGS